MQSRFFICSFVLVIIAGQILCRKGQSFESNTSSQPLQTLQYKYLIFTTQCYQTFFTKFNWLNIDCLKMTAAKIIGYTLVTGSAMVKLPQIIKLMFNKSVKGISFSSVILQLIPNILVSGYCIYKNNPFSLYGQNVFIGIQMFMMIILFIVYSDKNKHTYMIWFLIMMAFAYFISNPDYLPKFLIENTIILQIILISLSRLSQIYVNYSLKTTKYLSLITFGLSFLGNLGRIITILVQASNDYKYLLSTVSVAVLNATILFQFYYYNQTKPKQTSKTE